MPVNKSGEKGIFLPEYFSATVFAHTFAAHLGRASPMQRITKPYYLIKRKVKIMTTMIISLAVVAASVAQAIRVEHQIEENK